MSSLEAVELVDRIWARDSTVWTGRDEAHWLGWLDEPGRMLERLEELEGLDRDFDDVVLLGMGGSSLGPEVIRRTFGITRLHVLDTTHPTAIRRLEQAVDLDRTLFVGASKSGTTLETRSQLDYFLARGQGTFGAITDPGTELEQFARGARLRLRRQRRADDRRTLLRALAVRDGAGRAARPRRQDAARARRRDVRMVPARRGESGLRLRPPARRGLERGPGQDLHRRDARRVRALGRAADRRVDGEGREGARARARRGPSERGRPPARARAARRSVRPRSRVLPLGVRDRGRRLDPRHQPLRPAGRAGREGPDERHPLVRPGRTGPETGPEGSLDELLAAAEPPQYIAIQAFIDPAREGELDGLVLRARETGCVVTKGLGPRYLHSTGQLHKGGPNSILSVQVVDDFGEELDIPGRDFGFRQLIAAQAAGDLESLKERGRQVCRVNLDDLK